MKKIGSDLRQEFIKGFSFFLAAPALVWQVLFLYIPFACIVGISFLKHIDIHFWNQFTLDHFKEILQPVYFKIVLRSLLLACFTATICVVTAYPVVYYIVFKVKRFKNALLFLLLLPFWMNFLVQVYAWFFVLEKYGLVNNILLKLGLISEPFHLLNTTMAVYIVMIYCYIPFMFIPLFTVLEKFNTRLLEASSDLGANSRQTFWRITLPLSMSGIKTGFFLVFVPAFGEFVIPTLIGGGKYMYTGSLISYYFLVERNASAGAAFTVLSGLILLLSVLVFSWSFRQLFLLRIRR